jgi:hypothetical protein
VGDDWPGRYFTRLKAIGGVCGDNALSPGPVKGRERVFPIAAAILEAGDRFQWSPRRRFQIFSRPAFARSVFTRHWGFSQDNFFPRAAQRFLWLKRDIGGGSREARAAG